MAGSIDLVGFRALPVNIVFGDNVTGNVYVVPSPSKAVLNTGLKEVIKQASSQTGVKVNTISYASEETPTLMLGFPTATSFILGMTMGRKFVMQTISSRLSKNNILLGSNTLAPAPSSGFAGFGLAADVVGAKAGVFRGNDTVALTYAASGGFSSSGTTDSFCVLANGALKFSDNLINSPISYRIPLPASSRLALSDDSNFDYNVEVFYLTIEGQLSRLFCPSVRPVLGKNFDPSAETTEVELRVNNSGTCTPYTYEELGNAKAYCAT